MHAVFLREGLAARLALVRADTGSLAHVRRPRAGRLAGLDALRALSGVLVGVRAHVAPQAAAERVCLVALQALEGALASVHVHVFRQALGIPEGRVARHTLERADAGVHSHPVHLQGAEQREGLAAHLALVRALIGVREHVFLQLMGSRVVLVARPALKRADASVREHVHLEVGRRREVLAATLALERTVAMYTHVNLQMAAVVEGLVALLARVPPDLGAPDLHLLAWSRTFPPDHVLGRRIVESTALADAGRRGGSAERCEESAGRRRIRTFLL